MYKLPNSIATEFLKDHEVESYREMFDSIDTNYIVKDTVNINMSHIDFYENFITLQDDTFEEIKVKQLQTDDDFETLYDEYVNVSYSTGNQSGSDIYFFENEEQLNKFIIKHELKEWPEVVKDYQDNHA